MFFSFIYSISLHVMLIASLLFFLPPVYRITGDLESTAIVRLYSPFIFEERGKSPDVRALMRRAMNNKKTAAKAGGPEQVLPDADRIPETSDKPVPEMDIDGLHQKADIDAKSEAAKSQETPTDNEKKALPDSVENISDKEEHKPVVKEDSYKLAEAIEKQDVLAKDKQISETVQPLKPELSNISAVPEDVVAAEPAERTVSEAQEVYVQTDKKTETLIIEQAIVSKPKDDIVNNAAKDIVKTAKPFRPQGQGSMSAKKTKEIPDKAPLKSEGSGDVKSEKNVKPAGADKPVITMRDILNPQVFFMPKPQTSTNINGDAAGADVIAAPMQTQDYIGGNGGDTTLKISELPLPITPEIIKSPEPETGSQNISGIVVIEPTVKGYLKLEITVVEGSLKGLKVTAVYKAFPKNRRNQPMSKSEVRRARKIIEPSIVNHGDNITIYIISEAGEGVYDFMIESEGKPLKAGFVLKIYEQKDNMAVKSLGELTVINKTLITRILMPEGILWDDDSHFSGDMEDSESLTKFNKDSGLIWREYKE